MSENVILKPDQPINVLMISIFREFSGDSTGGRSVEVLPAFFKGCIVQSLEQTFGEIGGLSVPVDVLRFDDDCEKSGTTAIQAILRVPAKDYFKLRTALSLIHQFQGHSCRINVDCVSPVLLSLTRTAI